MHLSEGLQQCECEGQRGLKDRGNYCVPDCAPIHMHEHALRNICFPTERKHSAAFSQCVSQPSGVDVGLMRAARNASGPRRVTGPICESSVTEGATVGVRG